MKNIKLGILMFGLAGLVGAFLPSSGGNMSTSFFHLRAAFPTEVYLTVGGFALATLLALIAMAKPPLQRWQAGIALIGFALHFYLYRTHLGNFIKGLTEGPINGRI